MRLRFYVAGCLMVASAAMGAVEPLTLDWGRLETASDEQQAMSNILRTSVPAPTIQRLSQRGTAPWLVQFKGVIREEWKAALEEAGAMIKGYIPENGYLVEAAPAAMMKIGAIPEVAWVGEYLPAYKTSRAIREWPRGNGAEVRECDVVLFDPRDKARIVREFGEMPGASVSGAETLGGKALLRVWLSSKQVEEATGWGEVEWIEPYLKPRSWGALAWATDGMGDDISSLQQAFDGGQRIHLEIHGIADSGCYGVDSWMLDQFIWSHPELLAVVAAGNAATDTNPADGVVDAGSIGSPATAKNALSVGAAEGRRDTTRVWRDSWPEDFAVEPIALDRMAQADGPQGLAAFSGRGSCADGRIKPDLVAPGTFILVPRLKDSADTGWGVAADTNEIYVGGTGVAAEQAAAAATQARQWLAEARGITSPSAALVKALLIGGARDLAPGQYGAGANQEIPDARPNPAQGFGLLDLARAAQPGEGEDLDLHDAKGLATGATDTFELPAGEIGGRFVLTLAYSDCAAAFGAGKKLVNDLDLTVQKPSGKILQANGRPEPDALNNVEMIEFEADEAGTYVARVAARAVPMGGSQPYALVIRRPRMEAAAAAALENP
jgi:hypothetical protein